MRRVIAIAALLLAVAACGKDQDPGVVIDGGSGGPTTTSHALSSCPPGGPDATTPAYGCLDKSGKVLTP